MASSNTWSGLIDSIPSGRKFRLRPSVSSGISWAFDPPTPLEFPTSSMVGEWIFSGTTHFTTWQKIEALCASWKFIHLFECFQEICQVLLIVLSFDLHVLCLWHFAMDKRWERYLCFIEIYGYEILIFFWFHGKTDCQTLEAVTIWCWSVAHRHTGMFFWLWGGGGWPWCPKKIT